MLGNAENWSIYGEDGTSRTNMKAGVYADVSATTGCTTLNPRGTGTHNLRSGPISGGGGVREVYGSNLTEVFHGAAFFVDSLPGGASLVYYWLLLDHAGVEQLTIILTPTGTIQARRGDRFGTVIAESAAVITAGTYYYLEMYAKVGNADGAVEIRVNGTTVLDASSVDTQATANADYAICLINGVATGGPLLDCTDAVWYQPTGSENNDFLGDIQVLTVDMTADAASTGFVRNTGSNDFSCISDAAPDGDTTYVQAATSGLASEYSMGNLPANVSEVVGVVFRNMAKKTEAGTSGLKTGLVSALTSPATTSMGAEKTMTTDYTYGTTVFDTDPATGAVFTPAGFNAARARILRSA